MFIISTYGQNKSYVINKIQNLKVQFKTYIITNYLRIVQPNHQQNTFFVEFIRHNY